MVCLSVCSICTILGLLALLAVTKCFVMLYLCFKQKYSYWKNKNVPFANYSFPFGSIGSAIFLQTLLSRYCTKLYQKNHDQPYVGFYTFWSPALLIRNLDIVKDVLITKFDHFRDSWITVDEEVDPVMAKNLFPMPGKEWKVIRPQLTSQFSNSKFKQMIPMMQESGKTMIQYMKKQIQNSNCMEVRDLVARYTSDTVLMAVFGLEGNSFEVHMPVTFKIADEIASSKFIIAVKQTIGLFFPFLRRILKITFLGCPIPKSFWDLVLDTIKYREKNNIIRKDYLDFIRNLKKPGVSPYDITDSYTVAHAFTFFLDALETSSISFSFLMYELACNPDIQQKAREEAFQILEIYNDNITYEAVSEMEYIDNVVSEGIRKHPILAFLNRNCTEDYTISTPDGNDLLIEKGTPIFISSYGIHHDPQYFPNPEKFDPDRFTEEVKRTRPKISFLGFGEGPRICLGKNYGILQIKVGLALLLTSFEFRLNNACKPLEQARLHLINVPKNEILVDFHSLDNR